MALRARAGAVVVTALAAMFPAIRTAAEPAMPASAAGLTPRAAAEEAVANSPDLAAAYAAIDVARGRLLQAGLWPSPEISLAGRSDFAFGNEGERNLAVDVSQRFPIAGRLLRAQDVARVDVALALAEARDFERTLVGEVQRTVYAIAALDRAIETQAAVIQLGGSLADAAERRLRAAEASEVDENLLRIEVTRFEQERRRIELQRRTAAVALNRLLNRPPDAPLAIDAPLEEPLLAPSRDLAEAARARRPDLERARLESDRARAEARLARAETWEDWAVGAGYDVDRQVFADEPSIDPIGVKRDDFLGLNLSIPIPLWNRSQGRIAEAKANERRARARLAGLERSAEAEVVAARLRTEELGRIAREYREALLPRAKRNVDVLERGYRHGLVPISTLVQAEQQLAEATLLHARTLGELRQAEVDLETASATHPLLDRPAKREEDRP